MRLALPTLLIPAPPRGRWFLVGLVALAALTMSWLAAAAETDGVGEYELKAAVVVKLPLFVDWPTNAQPVVIGILGKDPFGQHLQKLAQKTSTSNVRLEVRACATTAEARQCQVVFIAASEKGRLAEILQALRGASVLTVGDTDHFGESGGMLQLASVNRRVMLQVNLVELRGAGLRVNPQLLQLAKVVQTVRYQR